jgi:hypothetical protein
MAADGFSATDPEYLAAQLYFSQSPQPDVLWVGRQDLTASPAETCVEAVTACRQINWDWYACMVIDAVKADHIAIAAYIESALPSSIYGFTTKDADVLLGDTSPANIFQYLSEHSYSRTIGQYASEDYAIAAIMGYAMGQNTGLANSTYTLKFKVEVGIATEDLDPTAIDNITSMNGNVYLSYGNYYKWFIEGTMANGQFFDEIINLDMLVNAVQLGIADVFYQNPKVPQTDAGELMLIHAVNIACDAAVNIGFLAPGVWTGMELYNLHYGDTLVKGYLVQSQAFALQDPAKREAREMMPIYIAIKEAGAGHSISVEIRVNR